MESKIDLNKITIVDNSLPQWIIDYGSDSIPRLPFYYAMATIDETEEKFFGNVLYHRSGNIDNRLKDSWFVDTVINFYLQEHLPKIFPNYKLNFIHRINLNGQLPNLHSQKHVDMDNNYDDSYWTMVYYIGKNSTGGSLKFFNDYESDYVAEYEYIPGRMVIFPSKYIHQAISSTKGLRVSLNVVCALNGV